MFNSISIEEFLKTYKKNNPDENAERYKDSLQRAVRMKQSGAKCSQCGQPIWAIGTATVGWDGCFTCISGETDNSDDYEIDSICY